MLKKTLHLFSIPLLLVVAFTGTVFAAGAASTDGGSLSDLLQPVWDAATHGHWWLAGSLALVAAVALFKRYAPGKARAWSHTDTGASILVLVGSFGGALATGLITAGTDAISTSLVVPALKVAFGAAGGYALIKTLVVGPLLGSMLWQRVPGVIRTPVEFALRFVFSKPDVAAEAEAAGDQAVADKPAAGADDVLPPTDL